jgi:acyl transferase domain-containing protein
MQIQMATSVLNDVSRQQLASLNRGTSPQVTSTVTPGPNGHSKAQHSVEGASLEAKPNNSASLLTCGEWSLYVKAMSAEVSADQAKSEAIAYFNSNSTPPDWNPASSGSKLMALAYQSPEDALNALKDEKGKRILQSDTPTEDTALVFMFPGVGDHYAGMAKGLYEHDPGFRSDIDYCLSKASGYLNEADLKSVLYPEATAGESQAEAPKFDFKAMLGRESKPDPNQEKLNTTRFSQTLVFILEYTLGRMWMRRGFVPDAMIGYSIGEYSAAVLAEIMDIDSALELVCKRALLIEKLPGGSMLAVPLNEEETLKWLHETNLYVAINSTPNQTVVAGNANEIDTLFDRLTAKEIMCRKIPSTHAFHTPFLSTIDADLRELVAKFTLKAPKTPLLSNVTGQWMTAENAMSPEYWAQHTWKTVKFAKGLGKLLESNALNGAKRRVFLEVGPGISLGSFMLQHPDAKQLPFKMNVPSVKSRYEKSPDEQVFLSTTAKLILAGCQLSNHKPSTIL